MTKSKFIISKRNFTHQITEFVRSDSDENLITVIWTTGARGLRQDSSLVKEGKFYEELEVTSEACDLSRLNAFAPFVCEHDANLRSTIGVVEKAWIEDGLGKATIRLSQRQDARDVIQDIKDGILRNISVGYKVLQFTDISQRGDSIPTLRATRWQPMELSLVSIGFDNQAKILRSADDQTNEVTVMKKQTRADEQAAPDEKEIFNALQAKVDAGEELSAEEQAQYDELKAKFAKPESKEEAAPEAPAKEERKVDVEAERKAAVAAYVEQTKQIRSAVKAASLAPEFAEELIARGLNMPEATQEIFKKLEVNNSKSKTSGSQPKEIKMNKREMAIEALMYRANSREFKCSEGNDLKGATLIQIAEAVVARNAGESDQAFAKRAITSSDLADILVSASNKVVSNYSYDAQYPKWTRPVQLRDFKSTPIVSLSSFTLASPSEGGDYAEASLVDTKENIQLRQRGKILSLSYQAMINDDADVLKQLPELAQKAGFQDLDAAAISVLTTNAAMADTKTMFHADHANLIADGTGCDVATLARAEQLLIEAVDGAGVLLELKPKYIIVPAELALAARKLVGSMVADSAENFNPYAGSGIEVIVSGRLTAADTFYVVADPAQMAAVVTGTLEGMEQPQVSSEEHFSSSNARMKVEFHNAAKSCHYQAAVKVVIDPA